MELQLLFFHFAKCLFGPLWTENLKLLTKCLCVSLPHIFEENTTLTSGRWILKWCSYFRGYITRVAALVMLGTSTPCRGFRKSGISSDLTGGTTTTTIYLCFWSLNHCQKELQMVLVHCLLPGHWPAQRQDEMLPFPDLSYWWKPRETAQKERGLFSTVLKKPHIPCAHLFYPSNVSKNVCVGLLVSGLLYFADQPYFCLVSGRQVQLHSRFGLALHSSFHVFWCALWELIVLPMPKILFSMSPFAADS